MLYSNIRMIVIFFKKKIKTQVFLIFGFLSWILYFQRVPDFLSALYLIVFWISFEPSIMKGTLVFSKLFCWLCYFWVIIILF